VLATLNHPHIGAIYELEEIAGESALVLELVEGPTLAERLKRGPMPVVEALAVARQVADALDAAHQKHIVHRDLKPANIVLLSETASSSQPRIKVLDFGIATTGIVAGLDSEHESTTNLRTQPGQILGTPGYMSPEQARGQSVDKRTDIWAFGCVLFEMLTGRRPFDGQTVSDTVARILEREPEWASLPPGTPGPVRTLLQRCLRKDPEKRLHDIADARIEIDDVDLSASPPGEMRRPRPLKWIALAALVLSPLAAAIIFVQFHRSQPASELFEFSIDSPKNATLPSGYATFAVAPDGRHIVIVALSDNKPSLWVRPIGTPEYRQLPGTDGGKFPFWKPDSQEIGFFADGKLKTVPVRGGIPTVVCDAPAQTEGTETDDLGATWNRDDVIVFMSSAFTLQKVAARAGMTPLPITTLAVGETAHRWPSFLPDGQRFLYLALGQPGDLGDLRIGSLDGSPATSLGRFESNALYSDGHLVFLSGAQLVAQRFDASVGRLTGPHLPVVTTLKFTMWNRRGAFSVSENGVLAYNPGGPIVSEQRLTWRDRTGRSLGTFGAIGRFPTIDLSPDGTRVAVALSRDGSNSDIWIIDIARGDGVPLTSDPAWEFDPAWSHDSNQLAFNSNRTGGRFSLFSRAANGSGGDELLVAALAAAETPVWTPDDRSIVYGDDRDLWIRPLDGSQKPSVLWKTKARERAGTLSADGRWMAYTSDKSGRQEIYVRAFPSGDAEHKVSLDGGMAARWRGDGKEVFFLSLDSTMMAARVETANGFKAMVPEPLFASGLTLVNLRPYAVARDGQRFLIPMAVDPRDSPPITVSMNWQARAAK
jgi:eukaryotic-like serine/threonine-protein kinase